MTRATPANWHSVPIELKRLVVQHALTPCYNNSKVNTLVKLGSIDTDLTAITISLLRPYIEDLRQRRDNVIYHGNLRALKRRGRLLWEADRLSKECVKRNILEEVIWTLIDPVCRSDQRSFEFWNQEVKDCQELLVKLVHRVCLASSLRFSTVVCPSNGSSTKAGSKRHLSQPSNTSRAANRWRSGRTQPARAARPEVHQRYRGTRAV